MYCLARYFQAYYPGNDLWKYTQQAAQWQFASLRRHALITGGREFEPGDRRRRISRRRL